MPVAKCRGAHSTEVRDGQDAGKQQAVQQLAACPASALPAAALVLAALHLGAAAQSTTPSETGRLEPVTVTAERRAENIKDVPQSVSTISGEMLDTINTGGQDIRMLAGRVPSLNIESSFGRAFPRFYIRGLGNTDFDLNASQPVSLVFDDVVQENPILKGFPVFDLERIEVLRGPQGTLFGRNSPAGVVKFESARARPRRSAATPTSGSASDKLFNLEGAVNVPLDARRGGARVAAGAAPRRLGRQHLRRRPDAHARRLRRRRRARAAAVQARRPLHRARSTCTRAT